MSEEEQFGRVELSQEEFVTQINIGREIIGSTFSTSQPFVEMGYTSGQCRIFQSLIGEISDGESTSVVRNSNGTSTAFRHSATFGNNDGKIEISTNGQGDYIVEGVIDVNLTVREGLQHQMHPAVYIFQNRGLEALTCAEFAKKIFSGKKSGQPENAIRAMLGKVPGVREMPGIKYQYQTYYLDDRTQKDIVIYHPQMPEASQVWRRLNKIDNYEVFGRKNNTDYNQIVRSLASQRERGLVFQGGGA